MPLLLVTAGQEDETALALEAGADACLRKPIQLGRLLETMVRLRFRSPDEPTASTSSEEQP